MSLKKQCIVLQKFLPLFFLFCSFFLFAQKKWNLSFYHQKVENSISVFADNLEEMPMSAKFTFMLDNLNSTVGNEATVVIPAKTNRFLIATLSPKNPYQKSEYSYTSMVNFGDVMQDGFDKDYEYSLPFEIGKTHLVDQGYNGHFSHQHINALDFNLKIGDKVVAAREGKVVQTVDQFNSNCANISCAKFNNKIVIMHSDGSFADYAHLKQKGVVVKIGDTVTKGQLIGYSGNTGFSNGPHLHFAVFLNRIDGKRKYIPTKFKTSAGDAIFLQEDKSYTKSED